MFPAAGAMEPYEYPYDMAGAKYNRTPVVVIATICTPERDSAGSMGWIANIWNFCGVKAGEPGALSCTDLYIFERVCTCCTDLSVVGLYTEIVLRSVKV